MFGPRARVTIEARRAVFAALLAAPDTALRRLLGPPPQTAVGALDLDIQALLWLNERAGPPPLHTLSPTRARAVAAEALASVDARPRAISHVRDLAPGPGGPPAPIRVYVPRTYALGGPALVYYHGGGGVIGSVASSDAACRALAADIGCVVASVEYRLAPEHRFPAGIQDAIAAHRWVVANARRLDADPARIAVGGDSMGANFSAVICQQARADGGPMPALQLLIYPAVDLAFETPSFAELGDGFLLTRDLMRWFRANYLRDAADIGDPRASPIRAVDGPGLSGLPPAIIATAGFDPLRDDGEQYAHALRAAGVAVDYRCYPGLIHGYLSMTGLVREARRAVADTAAAARGAW
jgi:acetyl esterase